MAIFPVTCSDGFFQIMNQSPEHLRESPRPGNVVHGITIKTVLLNSVPVTSVTRTIPDVAPAGTVAVIYDGELTVNAAGMSLKVTLLKHHSEVGVKSDE